MPQPTDVQFQERDGMTGLGELEGLLGGKQIVLPTLNHIGRDSLLRWIEDHRAPIDVVLRSTLARLLGRAVENVAEPLEHDRGIVWIREIKPTGKEAERIRQLGNVIGRQRLVKVRPADDR